MTPQEIRDLLHDGKTDEEIFAEWCRGLYAEDSMVRLQSSIFFALFPTKETKHKWDAEGTDNVIKIVKGRLDSYCESRQDGLTFQLPDFSGQFPKEE